MKKGLKKGLMLIIAVIALSVCFVFGASALDATGQCGDNVYWDYDSETREVIISGEGDMWDYYYDDNPFCNGGIKSVIIEDGVTSIGFTAFQCCDSLTSVTIGNSVISIGGCAFQYCENLISIEIPDGVTSIGNRAFYYCDSLTSIEVDANNEYYSSDEYGVLFNKERTHLMFYPSGNERMEYIIPDSVTSIGDSAFENCDSLTA